jgi:hypothetical protein
VATGHVAWSHRYDLVDAVDIDDIIPPATTPVNTMMTWAAIIIYSNLLLATNDRGAHH